MPITILYAGIACICTSERAPLCLCPQSLSPVGVGIPSPGYSVDFQIQNWSGILSPIPGVHFSEGGVM